MEGVLGSQWVGLKWFKTFLEEPYFLTLIKNTVLINVWGLLFYFPAPVILALMINEVRQKKLKKVIQTVSYLPYFFSVVVICGLILNLCSLDGLINQILSFLGLQKISFMNKPEWFRPIYILSEIWQKAGWSSIIYLAALSGSRHRRGLPLETDHTYQPAGDSLRHIHTIAADAGQYTVGGV